MMLIEGKKYHSIKEAAEETGYSEGTIRTYISNRIIEAEKLPDGEWLLTEAGMVALRRRKKAGEKDPVPRLVTMEGPEDQIIEVSKSIPEPELMNSITTDPVPKPSHKRKHHPEGFKEGALYIRTKEDHQDYDEIKEAADILHMLVGDLNMAAIRYYVRNILKIKITELKELESKKKDIIAGLSN